MDRGVDLHYCRMCSRLFVLANEKGYDTVDFITKIMSSENELSKHLFSAYDTTLWIGETYVMETIEYYLHPIKSNRQLSDDCMEWIGYLFKYWNYLYPNETAEDILRQAPIDVLSLSYIGLHCLSCEQAILDLKDMYNSKNKIPVKI